MRKSTLISFVAAAVLVLSSMSVTGLRAGAEPEDKQRFTAEEERYYDYTVPELYRAVEGETVSFTDRIPKKYMTAGEMPLYTPEADLPNSCGAVAGTIVVGYYDKYFEELIPEYVAYYTATGKYKRKDAVNIPQVMNQMYTLMRTNVEDVGVSQEECLNGLREYVFSKGRSIRYSSIGSAAQLDYEAYKAAINENKPVLIFCREVDTYTFTTGNNSETIAKKKIPGLHILVGYGYYTVKYYNGSANFRTDTYLLASSGLQSSPSVYIKILSTEWLIDGYAVYIS